MNTIEVLGEEQAFAQVINHTIQSFEDDVITSIGDNAFYSCTSLTTADFTNVTRIGVNAFNGCSSLATLILRANQVVTLAHTNAFGNASNCIIYVPDSFVDSYKAANKWSTFASRIKGISELPAA